MPQSNEIVNLWTFFDEWSRCISSRYQRDSLYRFGQFDNCSPQYKDLKLAVRAKMIGDEEQAKALVSETFYERNLGSNPKNSTTAGFIWELKDRPGWDA